MPRWFKFDPLPASRPNPRSRPIPIDRDPTDEELLATDNPYHLIGLQDPALQGADAPGATGGLHGPAADNDTPLGPLPSLEVPRPTYAQTPQNPIHGGFPREMDPEGSGAFGASRIRKRPGGETYTGRHEGIDIAAAPEAVVYSALTDVVTRVDQSGWPEKNIAIFVKAPDGTEARHYYVAPSVKRGDVVQAGQKIGTMKDIRIKYGEDITNHLHFELRTPDGDAVDPTALLRWGIRAP